MQLNVRRRTRARLRLEAGYLALTFVPAGSIAFDEAATVGMVHELPVSFDFDESDFRPRLERIQAPAPSSVTAPSTFYSLVDGWPPSVTRRG